MASKETKSKTSGKSSAKPASAKTAASKPASKAAKATPARTKRKVVKEDRVAIVAGARSAFARSWTTLNDLDPVELSTQVSRELLYRIDLPMEQLDEIVWGTVVAVPAAPNIAREIALNLSQYSIPGYTVTRACATGLQSVASATRMILTGERDVVLAGGVDVTSHAPVPHQKRVIDTLQRVQKQKGMAMVKTLSKLNPLDLLPKAPAIEERYTGKTMGQHAELMAQNFEISRESQEQLAIRSHTNAARATADGLIAPGLVPVQTPRGVVEQDNLIRSKMDPAKLARLRPVFDRKNGTITAATSSALTDGASALVLMKESKAKELGYEPLSFVRSWEFAALDPRVNLLLGNVYSIPGALQRAGATLADLGVIEIHEAFAAQVLSNIKLMASDSFCKEELGLSAAIGEVPHDRLNMWGGSLAFGHPFAATGGRMLIQLTDILRQQDQELGLASACAAGGLGGTVILERAS
ncbi:MAG TPA: acetyl-CoA C-acyltransferase [Myxococcales bacterium]|nr:acetyl-CoA C-acyltransferase [Myxococcales bacterium]